MQQFDLIVIGGGILGTFHAFHALNKGLKVALIERNNRPQSATVLNFGQVVPSGMDLKWQTYGRKSLEIYKELQDKFDIKTVNNGSIYIASNEEEFTLIEELNAINKSNDYESYLLTKEQCLQKYPSLNDSYCKAALFFPQEISADPRYMIHAVHDLMKQDEKFDYISSTLIKEIDSSGFGCKITDHLGNMYQADKVMLCCGSEFETLYPELFLNSDLELVKLQMLRLKSQSSVHIPGNILTGLTIRRYESFQDCPSYLSIKAKEDQSAYWKKWGVHILFKQEADGTIILGDSHEYSDVKNKDNIDYLIREEVNSYFIEEGRKIMNLDTWEVETSWLGIYSQCKENDLYQYTIDGKVHIVTGIGGKGMTGSAGYSLEHINKIYG